MTGQKRAAESEPSGRATRSSKSAKTETTPSKSPKHAKGKRGPKANLGATAFKARALPLHVNITHTPPSIPDEETTNATSADPGFIGTTALLPSTFSTGSYGWKGSKRISVELENGESGEKEKVHVMLTINATVMGSKGAKDSEDAEEDKDELDDEHKPEEAKEEAKAEIEATETAAEEQVVANDIVPTDA